MLHQEKSSKIRPRPLNNKHKFIVYFLYNEEDQNVHVEEAEDIDLSKVIQHLDIGGSVFITHRRYPQS